MKFNLSNSFHKSQIDLSLKWKKSLKLYLLSINNNHLVTTMKSLRIILCFLHSTKWKSTTNQKLELTLRTMNALKRLQQRRKRKRRRRPRLKLLMISEKRYKKSMMMISSEDYINFINFEKYIKFYHY